MDKRGADDGTKSGLLRRDAEPQPVREKVNERAWIVSPHCDRIPAVAYGDGRDRAPGVAMKNGMGPGQRP
jgi:hypothetical protein